MAICDHCELEMLASDGCTVAFLPFKTGDKPRIPRSDEPFEGYPQELKDQLKTVVRRPVSERVRCHDCGCLLGRFHHFGCDAEECPECRLQLISCSCAFADEEGDA